MKLTDVQIRAAAAREKEWKLYDENGLYVLVHPNGSKYWKFKYRFAGSDGKLSFGIYPEVSLKEARDRRDKARKLIRDGIDPKIQARAAKQAPVNTFRALALEWLQLLANPPAPPPGSKAKRRAPQDPVTIEKKKYWLDNYVFPKIGDRDPAGLTAPDVLEVLRPIEKLGYIDVTHRVRGMCSKIFCYGTATGRCGADPAAPLTIALTPNVTEHHPALIDPREVGGLLRAIDGYRGEPITRIALKTMAHTFLRSRELRFAEAHEFHFEAHEWRVPGPRMKMDDYHVVPLSRQAEELLKEAIEINRGKRYVFANSAYPDKAMSENTINAALARMGYKDEMTGHGFRTTATTLLTERGWLKDAVRVQLAHQERDKSHAAYDRAQFLEVRRPMMQAWSDYLDKLRDGNVVSFATRVA